jgi:hypothetical protein
VSAFTRVFDALWCGVSKDEAPTVAYMVRDGPAALLTMRSEGPLADRCAGSFPDAEVAEDHLEDVFDIDATGEAAKPGGGEAELLRDQFLAGALLRQLG